MTNLREYACNYSMGESLLISHGFLIPWLFSLSQTHFVLQESIFPCIWRNGYRNRLFDYIEMVTLDKGKGWGTEWLLHSVDCFKDFWFLLGNKKTCTWCFMYTKISRRHLEMQVTFSISTSYKVTLNIFLSCKPIIYLNMAINTFQKLPKTIMMIKK